jgi:hypothetical protein
MSFFKGLFGGSITGNSVAGVDSPLTGYEVVKSSALSYSDTGCAGWSIADGRVVTGGGFENQVPVKISKPGTPGLVTPWGYEYGPNEYGWIVCDAPDSAGSPNSYIYVIYASLPPPQVCGNGVVEGTEECDGGQCCVAAGQTGECTFEAVGTSCDDGLYCNVGEACNAGGECVGGNARDCSDPVTCTDDSCNEATDSCVNTPNNGNCADLGTCDDATGYIWTGVCDQFQDCTRQSAPQEICDGVVDDDCDGTVDNGCACVNGQTKQCGVSNIGACKFGTQTCVSGQWGDCIGAVYPQPWDTPGNNIDEDCNGRTICPVPCVQNPLTKQTECGSKLGGWRNHGMYVSCCAQYANDLMKSGVINEDQHSALVESCSQSTIGK